MEDFDAEEFFRMMFGGEQFIKIIGDFELAKAFKHALSEVIKDAENKGTEETREQKEEKMRKRLAYAEERSRARDERIEQLATNLTFKLSIFTESIPEKADSKEYENALNIFTEITQHELQNLLNAPHGVHLLHSIGYIYSSKAKLWLSKFESQQGHIGKRMIGFGKHFQSSWKERVHVVKETVKTVKCAVEWGQSMSKLAQVADEEAAEKEENAESQYPFSHHSGHLEYEGYVALNSTSDASTTSNSTSQQEKSQAEGSTSPSKAVRQKKTAGQGQLQLTEEEKRKLEADTAAKSMEALWRATKLEIESIERDVCDRVLSDTSCSQETRRRRCVALLEIGNLWQQAGQTTKATN